MTKASSLPAVRKVWNDKLLFFFQNKPLFSRIVEEKLRDSGAKRRGVFKTILRSKNSSEKASFLLVRFLWMSKENEQLK